MNLFCFQGPEFPPTVSISTVLTKLGYFDPVFSVFRDLVRSHLVLSRPGIFAIYLSLYTAIRPRGHSRQVCAKFWSFVKSLKKDASGINTLRENGILKTDTLVKANICNRQFQSAFTRETNDEIPSKGTSPFTAMGEITVDPAFGLSHWTIYYLSFFSMLTLSNFSVCPNFLLFI